MPTRLRAPGYRTGFKTARLGYGRPTVERWRRGIVMKKCDLAAVATVALMVASSPSLAAGDKPAMGGISALPRATVTATGNARIMALIAPGGALLRKKGVASVTNPTTGIYCLKPSSSSINLGTVVPTVSVDFSTTSRTDSIVQLRSVNAYCPAKTSELITLDRVLGGSYLPSNGVQFSVVIP
ncbi:MAG: hypothetical protein U1E52_04560 [Geminicoccaceae bacterium]